MSSRLPRHELWVSDDLRRRWLAWIGHGSVAAACRSMGLNRPPHWVTEGNIPDGWRYKIERQMAKAPDLGTLLADGYVRWGGA